MGPRIPRPGTQVRGSSSGRPVLAALDLLGRRWALRLLEELRREPVALDELRRRCDGMSSSVLDARLAELADAHLVAADDESYRLTPLGVQLMDAMGPLTAWSEKWARAAAEASSAPSRAERERDRDRDRPPLRPT